MWRCRGAIGTKPQIAYISRVWHKREAEACMQAPAIVLKHTGSKNTPCYCAHHTCDSDVCNCQDIWDYSERMSKTNESCLRWKGSLTTQQTNSKNESKESNFKHIFFTCPQTPAFLGLGKRIRSFFKAFSAVPTPLALSFETFSKHILKETMFYSWSCLHKCLAFW